MKKKNKKSEFRKYNYQEKVWIPYYYIMYVYWWNYLKLAHQEKRKIDWKYYKEWGGKKMFDVSFRTWWKKNFKKLFSQKKEVREEEIKYPMTTDGNNANAIKVALEVYRLKDKDGYEILDILEKKKKMGSFTGKTVKEKKEVNRMVKRYRTNAEKILDNVCKGIFP